MLSLLKALSYILGHIPYSLAVLSGRMLGALAFSLDKKRRKITIENLQLAFGRQKPPDEIEAIARRVFQNLAIMVFELFRLPWLTEKTLGSLVEVSGLENFDKALERKKGVILLTGHFGNWELLGLAHGFKGYTLDVVARELDSPLFEEYIRWIRTRSGNRIISKNRSMRKLLKSLSENRIATILIDQNVALAEGVFVDFFGTPACTNKGPAMLAAASGCAVVPAFIIREGKRHRLVIGEEIKLSKTGDKYKDAIENTERFTKKVEEIIGRYPDQWFWVHRRWKTRPPSGA